MWLSHSSFELSTAIVVQASLNESEDLEVYISRSFKELHEIFYAVIVLITGNSE